MYLCMYIIHVHVYYNSVEGKWITVSVMLFDCKSGREWEGKGIGKEGESCMSGRWWRRERGRRSMHTIGRASVLRARMLWV